MSARANLQHVVLRLSLLTPLIMACVVWMTGCVNVVTPPAVEGEPALLFVADYGKHASLLVPRGDAYEEWAFGDWDVFVLDENHASGYVDAMLFSDGAGLGRAIHEPFEPERFGRRGIRLTAVPVEPSAAKSLAAALDAQFAAGGATRRYNPTVGLTFVRVEEHYWLGHTCNDAVADWLRAAGCHVRGNGWSSRFVVRE
jgi:hypothetical protein